MSGLDLYLLAGIVFSAALTSMVSVKTLGEYSRTIKFAALVVMAVAWPPVLAIFLGEFINETIRGVRKLR
jgi:hypothetical protein